MAVEYLVGTTTDLAEFSRKHREAEQVYVRHLTGTKRRHVIQVEGWQGYDKALVMRLTVEQAMSLVELLVRAVRRDVLGEER